jgi:hypothetical protein
MVVISLAALIAQCVNRRQSVAQAVAAVCVVILLRRFDNNNADPSTASGR